VSEGFIGIDWGATFFKIGWVKKDKILRYKVYPSSCLNSISNFITLIKTFINENKIRNLKGIGIGCPGIIDIKKGLILWLPNIKGWENVPLKKILEKEFECKVYLDNDANLMALGEFKYGAGRGYKNIICLTLGSGLGGGVIIEGRLLHGRGFSSAELGHIPVTLGGRKCSCGNRGCIETFVGIEYITRKAKNLLKKHRSPIVDKLTNNNLDNLTPKILSIAAKKGCKISKKIWEDTGTVLGRYITGLVNIFFPEAVIIGGGISGAGNLILDYIRFYVKKYAMYPQNETTKILRAVLDYKATILGAKEAVENLV